MIKSGNEAATIKKSYISCCNIVSRVKVCYHSRAKLRKLADPENTKYQKGTADAKQ